MRERLRTAQFILSLMRINLKPFMKVLCKILSLNLPIFRLSASEVSKLDYEKLSTIVKELNTTMIQTNSTSLDNVNAIIGLKKVDMIV